MTTWNPSDKSANITLSNGDLTALGGASGGVRSSSSKSGVGGSKFHFEITADTTPATSTWFGVASGSGVFSITNTDLGSLFAVGVKQDGNIVGTDGSPTSWGLGAIAAGDVVMIEIDVNNQRVWFGKNGTFFGNPAAGTGSTSGPNLGGGAWFGIFTTSASKQATVNFGATNYNGAISSGFSSWDGQDAGYGALVSMRHRIVVPRGY